MAGRAGRKDLDTVLFGVPLLPARTEAEPAMSDDTILLLCARCLKTLTPGAGNFFQIEIHAVADPTPPRITESPSLETIRQEIQVQLKHLEDLSPQEALDQIQRRVTIHLCNLCFPDWIERPAGN